MFPKKKRSDENSRVADKFNSLAQFSKYKAQLKQLSDTISDGDCFFDTFLQGMRLNNDVGRFDSYRQLRYNNSSLWASQNSNCLVGDNLTLLQYLSNHLNKEELSLIEYMDWWKKMGSSKHFAESPVLAALGIYLDYNICV